MPIEALFCFSAESLGLLSARAIKASSEGIVIHFSCVDSKWSCTFLVDLLWDPERIESDNADKCPILLKQRWLGLNWLPVLRQNCDVEEMEMNLQMKNIIAASTGTRAEDDVLMVSIPHQAGPQATICNGKGPKFFPPMPLLWAPIGYVKRIEAMENSDHNTITIPEPHICRICDFDEKEHDDDVLVELGCSCKGQMSSMHRKCILKWYGVRMLLEKLYKCELCNTVLHPKAQLIVARGVADHENGGRATLMQALKSSLASYAPHIEVDRASTYKELVQLLLDERAEWYKQQRQLVASSREPFPPRCSRGALALLVGATLSSVGLYLFLIHHFYGNAAFH